jgi:hypothetical protein
MWGLWWTKWHWGTISPSTSVSPASYHSINFSIIITRGWHNSPIGGRSAERTQLDSTAHYFNFNFLGISLMNSCQEKFDKFQLQNLKGYY